MSSEVDPRSRLTAFANQHETQKAAAVKLGVSQSYLGDMMAGRRHISAKVLARLGLRRAVVAAGRVQETESTLVGAARRA